MEKHAYILERKKTNCKMYDYLPWYYYFVTLIINIIFINLNILDIDVVSFSGRKSTSSKYLLLISLTSKQKTIKKKKKKKKKKQIAYTMNSVRCGI